MFDNIIVIMPHKPDRFSDVRLALKGWRKFCTFKYRFILVGEYNEDLVHEFPWIEFIRCNNLAKVEGQYNPHLNMQHCLETVLNKYKNDKFFVRVDDDQVAIRPFTLTDIMTIHYHYTEFTGYENSPCSHWSHDKWKSHRQLSNLNLPHINYSTHFPYFYEVNKVRSLWEKFNMRNESYVFEDIYFNMYFNNDGRIVDDYIRLGVWSNQPIDQIKSDIDNSDVKFVSYSVEGYSKELNELLSSIVK